MYTLLLYSSYKIFSFSLPHVARNKNNEENKNSYMELDGLSSTVMSPPAVTLICDLLT